MTVVCLPFSNIFLHMCCKKVKGFSVSIGTPRWPMLRSHTASCGRTSLSSSTRKFQSSASQPPAAQQVFPFTTILQLTTEVCRHFSRYLPNCTSWISAVWHNRSYLKTQDDRITTAVWQLSARKARLNKLTWCATQLLEKQVERLEDVAQSEGRNNTNGVSMDKL